MDQIPGKICELQEIILKSVSLILRKLFSSQCPQIHCFCVLSGCMAHHLVTSDTKTCCFCEVFGGCMYCPNQW